MPRGDGTGPMGMGPRSGRGAGYCAGYNMPGFANPGFGLGMAWRRGWGDGFGWRKSQAWTPPTKEEMLQALKNQSEWLKAHLDAINKRIEELEKLINQEV